jgi:hypothetical protein
VNDRDPHDERECVACGLLVSDCVCVPREPTAYEIELAREERLSQAERRSLGVQPE